MMSSTRLTYRLAVVFALLLVCSILSTGAIGQTRPTPQINRITLGLVAEANQKEVEKHFQEFVGYVARKLSSNGKTEARVVAVSTQSRLANLLTERRADFYMESPHPTYMINSVFGAGKLLLRRWKGGMSDYRALIFTRKNSATKRLEDLPGKMIAFEDPESTSGHFLPRHFLTRRGFKFADKSRFDPYAAPTDIGYLFANSQEKVIDWVLSKKVAAGAFSDDDYARFDEKKRSEITILAETERLPRNLVSVRKDFAPALTDRLEKILLSMNEDDQGRKILKKTDDTTKFDLLPEGEAGLRRRLAEIFQSPKKN